MFTSSPLLRMPGRSLIAACKLSLCAGPGPSRPERCTSAHAYGAVAAPCKQDGSLATSARLTCAQVVSTAVHTRCPASCRYKRWVACLTPRVPPLRVIKQHKMAPFFQRVSDRAHGVRVFPKPERPCRFKRTCGLCGVAWSRPLGTEQLEFETSLSQVLRSQSHDSSRCRETGFADSSNGQRCGAWLGAGQAGLVLRSSSLRSGLTGLSTQRSVASLTPAMDALFTGKGVNRRCVAWLGAYHAGWAQRSLRPISTHNVCSIQRATL